MQEILISKEAYPGIIYFFNDLQYLTESGSEAEVEKAMNVLAKEALKSFPHLYKKRTSFLEREGEGVFLVIYDSQEEFYAGIEKEMRRTGLMPYAAISKDEANSAFKFYGPKKK